MTVPPGDYPVVLSRFRWLRGPGPIEAAVKVWVSEGPADSWEMAPPAGEDPRTLPDGGFFGIGVDAVTGCFFDAAAASAAVVNAAAWMWFFVPRRCWPPCFPGRC